MFSLVCIIATAVYSLILGIFHGKGNNLELNPWRFLLSLLSSLEIPLIVRTPPPTATRQCMNFHSAFTIVLANDSENKYSVPVMFCRYNVLLYKCQWSTRWAFAWKLDIFTRENNILSSHVKNITISMAS